MRVWLDDRREAPEGWLRVRTPEEAIDRLRGRRGRRAEPRPRPRPRRRRAGADRLRRAPLARAGGRRAADDPAGRDARALRERRRCHSDGAGGRVDPASGRRDRALVSGGTRDPNAADFLWLLLPLAVLAASRKGAVPRRARRRLRPLRRRAAPRWPDHARQGTVGARRTAGRRRLPDPRAARPPRPREPPAVVLHPAPPRHEAAQLSQAPRPGRRTDPASRVPVSRAGRSVPERRHAGVPPAGAVRDTSGERTLAQSRANCLRSRGAVLPALSPLERSGD